MNMNVYRDTDARQTDRYLRGLDGGMPHTIGRSGYRPEPERMTIDIDDLEPSDFAPVVRAVMWGVELAGVLGVVAIAIRVAHDLIVPSAAVLP